MNKLKLICGILLVIGSLLSLFGFQFSPWVIAVVGTAIILDSLPGEGK